MSKKELAAQYHASGCNCAMAVGCAFCDKAGVSEDEMKALTRRYGGGAYKYCGALLGAVAAMNMASGQLNEDDPAALDGKASDKAAELLRRFEAKNGSVFCRELKGATPALCSVRAAAASRMRPSLPKRYSRKNKCTVSLSSRTTPA